MAVVILLFSCNSPADNVNTIVPGTETDNNTDQDINPDNSNPDDTSNTNPDPDTPPDNNTPDPDNTPDDNSNTNPDNTPPPETTPDPHFSNRSSFGTAVHKGKLWVIGGYNGSEYFNDVWSSEDGIQWTPELSNNTNPGTNNDGTPTQFSQRAFFGTEVFNEKLWIIGGFPGTEESTGLNDVWSSPDGKTWTRVLADSPSPAPTEDGTITQFSRRYRFGTAATKTSLFVIGGIEKSRFYLNDVWSSSDGETWNPVLENSPIPAESDTGTPIQFSQRFGLSTAVTSDSTLWVMGGISDNFQTFNDVWSSTDAGATWTRKINDSATPASDGRNITQFFRRGLFGTAVVNDTIWVIGGRTDRNSPMFNDVWTSTNGEAWTQIRGDSDMPATSPDGTPIQFTQRSELGTLVKDDQVYIIGGQSAGNTYLNDVWSSQNGFEWSRILENTDQN